MPKPDDLPFAVVVTGGKQYRVSPGDRLLVDRLGSDPGAELRLDRLLLLADGEDLKLGASLESSSVLARVVEHRRGPKIAVIRYKPKKRVRVHKGARADLTLLEILEVGGRRMLEPEKPAAKVAKPRGGRLRRRGATDAAEPAVAAAPAAEKPTAELTAAEPEETPAAKPTRRPRRRTEEADSGS